jgi:hypothetical protein
MVASVKKYLGNGLYTLSEAALYARVSPVLLSRWLFGTLNRDAVIVPQFGGDERLVSFLDLVQALAVREICLQRKVPLVKFRQAIKIAKDKFGLDHPFARQHFTYLFGDELVIRPGKDEFVEASGKHKGQRLFPFVEVYLKDLSFDRSGLANRYQVFTFKGGHADGRTNVPVVMDPERRFGEPLLPSGYSARTLWEAIQAEGGIERTAKVYQIPREEVEASYRFFVDHLGKTVA